MEKTGTSMKKRIALSILALGLLVAAVGCELYTGITLNWSVDTYSPSGTPVHVTYTVQNSGQYDLTGVNLEIGVATNTGYYYSQWSPSFSLNKGEIRSLSMDVPTNGASVTSAAVLSVDMDSPSGTKTVYYKK